MVNAGGFPNGVSLENLLTVPSTPRNRLLADVLSKAGIVERSGQGIDKIFFYTLAEGKPKPDYSKSDDFDVTAILSAMVKDAGFAVFIQNIQNTLPDNEKLTVFDIIELCKIRDGEHKNIVKDNVENAAQQRCHHGQLWRVVISYKSSKCVIQHKKWSKAQKDSSIWQSDTHDLLIRAKQRKNFIREKNAAQHKNRANDKSPENRI